MQAGTFFAQVEVVSKGRNFDPYIESAFLRMAGKIRSVFNNRISFQFSAEIYFKLVY